MPQHTPLEQAVRERLEQYFRDLDGDEPHGMLDMVLRCAERPTLEVALQKADGNQSLAARMLGITRSTLRKKLALHGLTP